MRKKQDCPGQLRLDLELNYTETFNITIEKDSFFEDLENSFYCRRKHKSASLNPILAEIVKSCQT